MNILFIENAANQSAGAFHSLVSLINCLKDFSVNAYVIIPPSMEGEKILKDNDIKYFVVKECSYSRMISLEASALEWIKMPFKYFLVRIAVIRHTNIIKKNKIDIVHENTSVCYMGYYLAKRNNIKHIWHIREFL